ncbi:DNA-3-methyladenine glycosylase I, partial [Enterococcus faecium]
MTLNEEVAQMRCPWSELTESMRQFHDTVWVVPE